MAIDHNSLLWQAAGSDAAYLAAKAQVARLRREDAARNRRAMMEYDARDQPPPAARDTDVLAELRRLAGLMEQLLLKSAKVDFSFMRDPDFQDAFTSFLLDHDDQLAPYFRELSRARRAKKPTPTAIVANCAVEGEATGSPLS